MQGRHSLAPLRELSPTRVGGESFHPRELITTQWDKAHRMGLLRYDSNLETKLHKDLVFIANPGRFQKPPATLQHSVLMPFNPTGFNFGRVRPEEMIGTFQGKTLMVNAFPILRHHFLMVSSPHEPLHQAVEGSDLTAAFALLLRLGDDAKMGYNSTGAFSSINHRHYQGLLNQAPFAIEKAKRKPLGSPVQGVMLSYVEQLGFSSMVLSSFHSEVLAREVVDVCQHFEGMNQLFNLFFGTTKGELSVFLMPQNFQKFLASKEGTRLQARAKALNIAPACWELAGLVIHDGRSIEAEREHLAMPLIETLFDKASLTKTEWGDFLKWYQKQRQHSWMSEG